MARGPQAKLAAKKKIAQAKKDLPKKPHRFHPGVKRMMRIRKEQKSRKSYLPTAPFSRAVRQMNDSMYFSSKAMSAMKEGYTYLLVKMPTAAGHLSDYSGRVTTTDSDLLMAAAVGFANVDPEVYSNIQRQRYQGKGWFDPTLVK